MDPRNLQKSPKPASTAQEDGLWLRQYWPALQRNLERLCSDEPSDLEMCRLLLQTAQGLLGRLTEDGDWHTRVNKMVRDGFALNEMIGEQRADRFGWLLRASWGPQAERLIAPCDRARDMLTEIIMEQWGGSLTNLFTHEYDALSKLLAGKFELTEPLAWEDDGMNEVAAPFSTFLLTEEIISIFEEAELGGVTAPSWQELADRGIEVSYGGTAREGVESWIAWGDTVTQRLEDALATIVYYTNQKMQAGAIGRLSFAIKQLTHYISEETIALLFPQLYTDQGWAPKEPDDDEEEEDGIWWISPVSALNLDLYARQLDRMYEWAAVSVEFRKMLNAITASMPSAGPQRCQLDLSTGELVLEGYVFVGWDNSGWIGPPPNCIGITLNNCAMHRCALTMTPATKRWLGLRLYDEGALLFDSCTMSFDALIDNPTPQIHQLLDHWLGQLAQIGGIVALEELDDELRELHRVSLLLGDACMVHLDGKRHGLTMSDIEFDMQFKAKG